MKFIKELYCNQYVQERGRVQSQQRPQSSPQDALLGHPVLGLSYPWFNPSLEGSALALGRDSSLQVRQSSEGH